MTVLQKWLFRSLACSMLGSTISQVIANDCGLAPVPYNANYSVTRKGKPAGSMQMVLERKGTDTFSYRMASHVKWGIVHPHMQQLSNFSWKNGVVLPGTFRSTQKLAFYKRKESVDFNWESMKASGTKKRHDFELEIQTGMQDKLTIYLHLARAVCEGEDPINANVVSGPVLKAHSYHLQAIEFLATKLGPLQTFHVRRGTSKNEKQTDLWLAEETLFLPVKLVYRDKNDVITMNLIDISFSDINPGARTSGAGFQSQPSKPSAAILAS